MADAIAGAVQEQKAVAVAQPTAAPAPMQEAAKPKRKAAAAPKKRTGKKAGRVVFVKSKRKTSVARASVKSGSGKIRVNGFDINTLEPITLRKVMLSPLDVSHNTRSLSSGLEMRISVYGGGQSSQAQAVRGAIAKGLATYSENDSIRKEIMQYDRSMLVDDSRRVEPKKFKGPKARARFQKSYR